MGKRWAIAGDPKLLARIAMQEQGRGLREHKDAERPEAKGSAELGGAVKSADSAAVKRARKVAINNQDSRLDSMHYDESSKSLTIVLTGAMLLSFNVSLRMHDAKSTQIKKTWLKRIEALKLTNKATFDRWRAGVTYPLLVEEVYATREISCLDIEAVVAACKPIIDSLVKLQFIPDDSREYIAQPLGYTYRQAHNGLVLTLRPSPKPWGLISESTMNVAKGLCSIPSVLNDTNES